MARCYLKSVTIFMAFCLMGLEMQSSGSSLISSYDTPTPRYQEDHEHVCLACLPPHPRPCSQEGGAETFRDFQGLDSKGHYLSPTPPYTCPIVLTPTLRTGKGEVW